MLVPASPALFSATAIFFVLMYSVYVRIFFYYFRCCVEKLWSWLTKTHPSTFLQAKVTMLKQPTTTVPAAQQQKYFLCATRDESNQRNLHLLTSLRTPYLHFFFFSPVYKNPKIIGCIHSRVWPLC
jgi:hypothetical protein